MKKREIETREDVCAADLQDLNIISGPHGYTGDMANIYVSNETDDVYIGELCDRRLLALVRNAPKLAEFLQFLRGMEILNPDLDHEWTDFVDELGTDLGLF